MKRKQIRNHSTKIFNKLINSPNPSYYYVLTNLALNLLYTEKIRRIGKTEIEKGPFGPL